MVSIHWYRVTSALRQEGEQIGPWTWCSTKPNGTSTRRRSQTPYVAKDLGTSSKALQAVPKRAAVCRLVDSDISIIVSG